MSLQQLSLPGHAIALAQSVPDAPATSWIQLAVTGKFYSPVYGNFSITPSDLQQIVRNFATVTPKAPTKLPIDYNHGTAKGEITPETGKAAGWIDSLELRADGRELWGLIEWTDAAAKMIAAKEYQYVSPVIAFHYTHQSGEDIGTTLLSAAVTNTPFLEGMQPLSLAKAGAIALDAEPDQGAAAGDAPGSRGEPMPIKVTDVKGNEIELADDVVTALAKRYAPTPAPKAEAAPAADAARFTDLETKIATLTKGNADLQAKTVELAATNASLKTQLDEQKHAAIERDATDAVATIIAAGKALPAQKDHLVKLALLNRELFDQYAATLPVVVKLNTETGSGAEAGDQPAYVQATALAKPLMDADKALTLDKAIARVFADNPELYTKHVSETRIKV